MAAAAAVAEDEGHFTHDVPVITTDGTPACIPRRLANLSTTLIHMLGDMGEPEAPIEVRFHDDALRLLVALMPQIEELLAVEPTAMAKEKARCEGRDSKDKHTRDTKETRLARSIFNKGNVADMFPQLTAELLTLLWRYSATDAGTPVCRAATDAAEAEPAPKRRAREPSCDDEELTSAIAALPDIPMWAMPLIARSLQACCFLNLAPAQKLLAAWVGIAARGKSPDELAVFLGVKPEDRPNAAKQEKLRSSIHFVDT